ncbi:MAG: acetate kinase [Clostridia bacterium]|nr:acetate kinase [Clostridia bacterium]
MKILVINAGSSSLKYQLIDMETEVAIAKGGCERIGLEGSFLKHNGKKQVTIESPMPNHESAIKLVLDALVDSEHGVISSMSEIDAVGHRIVHSGEDFDRSVLLTDEVIETCRNNTELAPLHQPANLTGVAACKAVLPEGTPMVGVFDTAFHSTMPEHAYIYGIPYEDYKNYKIRRYGFHGSSHRFVSEEAAKYLGKDPSELKIVTCHLGNGSSISAVDGGKSVDTSMSFTPLGGVPMGTRSGDLDPAIVEFLCKKHGFDVSECVNYLNKKSGVSGLSGVSSDFRDLGEAAEQGNHRAQLALDVFTYTCKKYVGAYAAAMGGIDCLVFTAGIGENDNYVRSQVLKGLEFMGVVADLEKNAVRVKGINDITGTGSRVKVLVIPTNEELVIARDTKEIVCKA